MELGSIISIGVGILSFVGIILVIGKYAKSVENLVERHKTCPIYDIQTQLARLETKMEPFWSLIEIQVAKMLHSPHTPEMDILLEKLIDGSLNLKENLNLDSMLCETLNEELQKFPKDNGKILGLTLLLARLRSKQYDD